jgi:hypothetical protein
MSWSQEDDAGFNQAMHGLLTKLIPGAAASGSRGPAKPLAAKKETKPNASKGALGAGTGKKRKVVEEDDDDDLSGIFSGSESASPPAKKPRAQKKAGAFQTTSKPVADSFDNDFENQMKSSFTHFLKTGGSCFRFSSGICDPLLINALISKTKTFQISQMPWRRTNPGANR